MSYTILDRGLAWVRFRVALRYVGRQARVCDLGCGVDAGFLRWARRRIRYGVGVDQQIARGQAGTYVLRADLAHSLPLRDAAFDHVVMLAVLEHLADPAPVLREAFRILAPGGSLIMTWPNQVVDRFLAHLETLGVISGAMGPSGHQRRVPLPALEALLANLGFERCRHSTFECGLNNLIVGVKPERESTARDLGTSMSSGR